MMSSVHLSPTRSRARASGDHWSYGCRLGGGGPGIGIPPCNRVVGSYEPGYRPIANRLSVGASKWGRRQFSAMGSLKDPRVWVAPNEGRGRVTVGDVIRLDEHRRVRE